MTDSINPNWLAFSALFAWPLVAVLLYGFLSRGQATLWTILGAQLLLPTGTVVKIQMIPQFDKNSIPSLCVLIGCMVTSGRAIRIFHRSGWVGALFIGNLIAPICSVFENQTTIFIGGTGLPAADYYNAGSASIAMLITLIPFFVGRQFLGGAEDLKEILRAITLAGLAYSIPTIIELRFSPQFHIWLYGYSPTDFVQVLRGDGYRPMVLMGHGLVLAFFLAIATMAATARWNIGVGVGRIPPAAVAAYLGVILALCKSFGATVYALCLVPLIRFGSAKLQVRVAFLLALLALSYPLLRSQDLVPTSLIVQAVDAISPDRAESIKTRFENEDALLSRASERLLFGWGGFGRNRVYSEDSGRDTSLTDGRWILSMGNYGLLGFLAEFGLLGIGVFRAWKVFAKVQRREDRMLMAALALMVAINIVELLPNSTLIPFTWLLAGSLVGRTEAYAASYSAARTKALVRAV
jgi:hypothetical protein